MADSPGISGAALGLATAGGLLLWSAIRNVTPVDTVRFVLGRPNAGTPISTPFSSVTSGVRGAGKLAVNAGSPAGTAGAGLAGSLVAEARKMIGTPYVWAGTSASGVDCSGLVVLCLRRAGVGGVPRFNTATFGSWAKGKGATKVGPDSFQAGDVILHTGHMGIAVSPTRLIHAATPGTKVKEADIWNRSAWWGWRLTFKGSTPDGTDAKPAETKR